MFKLLSTLTSRDWKRIIGIILLFCFTNSFFNYKPIVLNQQYSSLIVFLINGCFIVSLFWACSMRYKDNISKCIIWIMFMFIGSMILPPLFWDQSLYYTFRSMYLLFPICFYFIFDYFKVTIKEILVAVIILTVLYSIFELIAISSFPNNIFGYNEWMDADSAENSLEQRGVIRLSLPGADFVIFSIFIVLTYFKDDKKKYWFLIPLFFLLAMRGTRTPLFIAILMTAIYIIFNIKRKIISIVIFVFIFFSYNVAYNCIQNSDSDDILVKYVQLTSDQFENEDEDIRVTMTKYVFSKFNHTFFQDLFGNGIYSVGKYGNEVHRIFVTKSLAVTDVLPAYIFLLFGYFGLILYLVLFVKVIKSRVKHENQFGKMMVIYFFLIGVTNCALILGAPLIFAMSLYVVHEGINNKRLISVNRKL